MGTGESKKKRILFIVKLPPPVYGAALSNLSLVQSRLLNERYDIDLLAPKYVDDVKDLGSIKMSKLFVMLISSLKLMYRCIVKRPDLVYFTITPIGGGFIRDCLYTLIIKIFNLKILFHLRARGIYNELQNPIKKYLYKHVFKNSYIICLSNRSVDDIVEVYDGYPIIVENGIKIFCNENDINYSQSTPVKILYLSHLSKEKGVLDFLNALIILNKKTKIFEGRLVGSGKGINYSEISKIIEENKLTGKLFLLGPKYGDEKKQELINSDIFVFPTHFENFPRVILEAMQCGKAIVTTNEGAIPDIIDDGINGFVLEKGDVIGIADKIEMLIDDVDLRVRIGRKAREKYLRNYTYEIFENNMLDAFSEVLDK